MTIVTPLLLQVDDKVINVFNIMYAKRYGEESTILIMANGSNVIIKHTLQEFAEMLRKAYCEARSAEKDVITITQPRFMLDATGEAPANVTGHK